MINGSMLRDAVISAANNISNNRTAVDELNVFPVPDGDTGTNMSMTMGSAGRELALKGNDLTVGEVAKITAAALLRGARGNSGVITSLLFRGFSKGLKGKETASGADVAHALQLGVESAYKAVMKPTEGTILTVARVAAEHAVPFSEEHDDVLEVWDEIIHWAKETLEETPEMLPVLKKAGVVDAGGKGLIFILEGMRVVLAGGTPIAADGEEKKEEETAAEKTAESAEDLSFTYSAEFLVNKESDKKGDALSLRAYLETIGGNVSVTDEENTVKVSVYTDNPGKALQAGLKVGSLTDMKIENMREKQETQAVSTAAKKESPTYRAVDPNMPFGFVAVAAGQGLEELFRELGVNEVVSGGQTMNPSTDDILAAIQATPAETVFVFPNNKNIIMAAEQAVHLADRNVCVIQTKTIPQGIAAMLAFDSEASSEDNQLAMIKAMERIGTGQLTFAARDSDYDGHKIKAGEILALENGKVSFTDRDLTHAAVKLVRALTRKDTSFITLIYGEDVSDEKAEEVETALRAKLPEDIEITLVNGGQPVYYFIISVE